MEDQESKIRVVNDKSIEDFPLYVFEVSSNDSVVLRKSRLYHEMDESGFSVYELYNGGLFHEMKVLKNEWVGRTPALAWKGFMSRQTLRFKRFKQAAFDLYVEACK